MRIIQGSHYPGSTVHLQKYYFCQFLCPLYSKILVSNNLVPKKLVHYVLSDCLHRIIVLMLQKPTVNENAKVAKQRRDTLVRGRLAGLLSDEKTQQILQDIRDVLPEISKVHT